MQSIARRTHPIMCLSSSYFEVLQKPGLKGSQHFACLIFFIWNARIGFALFDIIALNDCPICVFLLIGA